MPDAIVKGVAYHHRPRAFQEKKYGPDAIIYAADLLEHFFRKGAGMEEMKQILDADNLSQPGLTEKISVWW